EPEIVVQPAGSVLLHDERQALLCSPLARPALAPRLRRALEVALASVGREPAGPGGHADLRRVGLRGRCPREAAGFARVPRVPVPLRCSTLLFKSSPRSITWARRRGALGARSSETTLISPAFALLSMRAMRSSRYSSWYCAGFHEVTI